MKKINLLILAGGFFVAACSSNDNDKALDFTNDLENVKGWSGNESNIATIVKAKAKSGEYVSKTDTVYRYGFLFRAKLYDLTNKKLKAVKAAVWANVTEVNSEAVLVISVDSVGKSIVWEGKKLIEVVKKTDEWTEVIADADLSKLKPCKDYIISVYLWNTGKSVIYTDDHRVRFTE